MNPYTRYTFQTLHALPERVEDSTNLTCHRRTLEEYSRILCFNNGISLETFFSHLQNRKIRILDCGAGSGVALDQLLSGPYRNCIEKCVGISLHYFQDVSSLLQKHKEKLEWILGPAEKILPELDEQFDIIFDVFGAYHYCSQRPLLIEQYHRVLKISGRALIHKDLEMENIVLIDKNKENLEEYYERHSQTFSLMKYRGSEVFTISKFTENFPFPELFLSKVKQVSSSIHADQRISKYRLKKGNALRPVKVYFRGDRPKFMARGVTEKTMSKQKF